MDWNLILTILTVITILISGSVYVVVLVTKVTTRVRDVERDILDQKERVKNLEDKTSFENLEKVTQRVLTQAIHSKEFKESMRAVTQIFTWLALCTFARAYHAQHQKACELHRHICFFPELV